ncbi:transcription elongation factor GreA [Candidatus Roizmanbacteria bacterium RIFCSPLOWO2_02_FULL_37_19]|uniref:Transcription elongation factor GreA n=1 Tax=Candidatus Roizmanbacteria bacterium RIFCSPHIGHO2_02_FULL_37_24 TaxID=1802037 RepID=A0A1F7H0P8_9BACT|nr:MAG: transcription elongation factor GreA [Candidatus Roizmanbacteria bacterium RIFCSPHIGHO2_01_FULL_38_41]OGK24761.1 MAG: transcription elongation factor GreA [Candidatus Roizmanbacteria bacterium RIFCSPHIGHO2_02_FULL_37_24]OGK31905.1 MAG: transcription elongation factor GreA [Candidatus Roizmanbacteria bacterium RIFCSPHIGHO2_12_FULL_37_23]OGK45061.1 MAG: transcription elongation factor GreA [Candidatus Roizmanbacteria bacterium RIFCSPLOWO2_01_FULL_37_57]OGK53912.1 MAG: transcription elonga
MNNIYKLSQQGYDKLLAEYNSLKEDRRPHAVERLAKARSMGDLSENSEYTAAREELNFIDSRIHEIETIINNVQIVDVEKSVDAVKIGNTVVIETNGQKETFRIVGELEANIQEGSISDSSPIGKALLGSRVGSEVTVKAPAGELKYKVIEIK